MSFVLETTRRAGRVRRLALTAAVALVVAACGSSDDSSAPAAAPAPAPSTGGTTAPATPDPRADWPAVIRFAAVPAEQDAQLTESYRVTTEILADELGLEVEFFQAADYAGVIEALIANRVELAQFGPFSYVLALARGAEATAVGVMTGSPEEEPGYQSYLVARADNTEINTIQDIKGKNVCLVDPASTSGYLVPFALMLDEGINPEEDINIILAGGHDTSVIEVAAGTCDAGFAFDDMVDSLLIERGEIEAGEMKIVQKSFIIAGSPMAMRTELPASLQEAITDVIQNKVNVDWAVDNGYCAAVDDCSLSDEAIWGYAARDDSFYDGIRTLCGQLGTAVRACEGIS